MIHIFQHWWGWLIIIVSILAFFCLVGIILFLISYFFGEETKPV